MIYRYDRRNRTTAKAHITAMNVADLTGNLPHEDDRRHHHQSHGSGEAPPPRLHEGERGEAGQCREQRC